MSTRDLVIVCLAAMLAGLGCAGTPPAPPPPISSAPPAWPEAAPSDFSLSAAVAAPAGFGSGSRDIPRAMRPGRFLLESNGRLRWSGSARIGAALPPIVRELDRGAIEELWRAARGSGAFDAAPDTGNPDRPLISGGNAASARLELLAGGRQRVVTLPLDRASPEAIAAERLVDRLAALAWVH